MEKYQVEIKETLSEIIDIEANNEEEAIEKVQKQYKSNEIVLKPNSYKETDFKICKDEWVVTSDSIFKEYKNLTDIQRKNLDYFVIINSIRNCDIEKRLTLKEEYKLFNIINKAQRKNEENIDISTIADNIVKAFVNGAISMKALDKASGGDILNCIIGIGDFDYLDNKMRTEFEEVEELEKLKYRGRDLMILHNTENTESYINGLKNLQYSQGEEVLSISCEIIPNGKTEKIIEKCKNIETEEDYSNFAFDILTVRNNYKDSTLRYIPNYKDPINLDYKFSFDELKKIEEICNELKKELYQEEEEL